MAFSFNNKQLALASDDYIIKLWDTVSGTLQQTLKYDAVLYNTNFIAFLSDFLRVALSNAVLIIILNITSGKILLVFEGYLGSIFSITFLLNNRWLASGAEDKTVKL